ncbi:MAG: CT583 family protein [Verrucomicrobia bacterium]|nr:CT583 family protein [Verrucomicrobiota bacterium]
MVEIMGKVNALLKGRFQKKEKSTKMAALAEGAKEGKMSGFAGVFALTDLPSEAKESLFDLLAKFAPEDVSSIEEDHRSLCAITCEVRAISNQAALLHGERIKKAQTLLKQYKEGAFSAWLVETYGNRQTPYNFLQYFEFYHHIPLTLRPQLEAMPRQAVYTLASRAGDTFIKEEIVKGFNGQTKAQLLDLIREMFPLPEGDLRKQNFGEGVLNHLRKLQQIVCKQKNSIDVEQKREIRSLLTEIEGLLV